MHLKALFRILIWKEEKTILLHFSFVKNIKQTIEYVLTNITICKRILHICYSIFASICERSWFIFLIFSLKTEKKTRPLPSETQYNYAIPEHYTRPTSPVQKLLERGNTQPFMSLQGSVPGSEMDPITRQYYHRVWKSQAPTTDM